MDRRTFMSWVGVGLIASSLPVAIAACSPDRSDQTKTPDDPPPPPGTSPTRADGFTQVGTVASLDAQGSIIDQKFSPGPLVVLRNPDNQEKLVALNAKCTHRGCAVVWESDSQLLACPCHGSQFKSDGSVAKGPATQPLLTWEVKTEGDAVLVKA